MNKKLQQIRMMTSQLVVEEVADEVAMEVVAVVVHVDEAAAVVASGLISRLAMSLKLRTMTTISTVRLPNLFAISKRRRI